MLSVKNLSKIFRSPAGDVIAVDKADFIVARGELVSITGKSGSGKSTLLNLLSGLDLPTSGSVQISNTDISKMSEGQLTKFRARLIGFVFQSYNLIPNLTAIENVAIAMEAANIHRGNRVARARSLLGQVGLEPSQMLRKPAKLSGGQQQRVAIARALANDPAIVFADEPTGNLDENTGQMIIDLLRSLAASHNTTFVIVTHDATIAKQADKVLTIKDGKVS